MSALTNNHPSQSSDTHNSQSKCLEVNFDRKSKRFLYVFFYESDTQMGIPGIRYTLTNVWEHHIHAHFIAKRSYIVRSGFWNTARNDLVDWCFVRIWGRKLPQHYEFQITYTHTHTHAKWIHSNNNNKHILQIICKQCTHHTTQHSNSAMLVRKLWHHLKIVTLKVYPLK